MTEQPSKGSQLFASGKELFTKLSKDLPKDLNSLRQQTTPLIYRQENIQLQLYIKALRAVKDDRAKLSVDSQVASKNLFLWSKDDTSQDVVDIFDRAAFLQFKTSELEQAAANRIEESRLLFKDVRNFENDLSTRRKNRSAIATRLQTLIEKDRGKNTANINSLQNDLSQLDNEIYTFEQSFASLKRQKLHESFALQFSAQRELGEKLAIVGGYGELLLQTMESEGIDGEYEGKDRTAQIKVELEQALQAWKPSSPPVLASSGASLHQSDTRSFGATHADQLSQLGSDEPITSSYHSTSQAETGLHSRSGSQQTHFVPPLETIPGTPGDPSALEPHHRAVPPLPARPPHQVSSPPPPSHSLNLSPTPQDLGSGFSPPQSAMSYPVPHPPAGVSAPSPTMAETGAPKIGTGGPSSGQLRPRSSSISKQTPPSQIGGGAANVDNLAPLPPPAAAAQTQTQRSASPSMPGSLPFDEAGWDGVSRHSSIGQGGAGGNERLPTYGEGDDEARRANDEAERILASERERKGASA